MKPRSLIHRLLRFAVVLGVVIVVATLAGLPVFVHPQLDRLRHADAILILGGWGDDRYKVGFALAAEGWAPNLVVSANNGDRDISVTKFCSTSHSGFATHCFVPNPLTTIGEAQELGRLATEHNWRTVIVVTYRPHISWARFILQQCYDGDLIMVVSPHDHSPWGWLYEYPYQTAAYIKSVFRPAC
jgi:uncharacterized SAM-binding protein YcdF (DUF218 family)